MTLLAVESNLQKKDGHDLPTAPKGISLTPNFSWVATGRRRTDNRFNGFSAVQAHAALRIQAIGPAGKTAEAVRTSWRTLPTQLKLGVNERRTIALKPARNRLIFWKSMTLIMIPKPH